MSAPQQSPDLAACPPASRPVLTPVPSPPPRILCAVPLVPAAADSLDGLMELTGLDTAEKLINWLLPWADAIVAHLTADGTGTLRDADGQEAPIDAPSSGV